MPQHMRPIGPTGVNAQAVFTSSMTDGCRPQRSPVLAAWKTPARNAGTQLSQTTHVQAAFTPSMSQGSGPDRDREYLPLRTGSQVYTPDGAIFSAEAVIGSRPTSPRLFSAPRLQATSLSQMTHVAAPFTSSMAAGSQPPQPRPFDPQQVGYVAQPPDVQVFSVEMVQGSKPERSRATIPQQSLPIVPVMTLFIVSDTDILVTLPDIVAPGIRGLELRRRVGYALAPDVASFSIEMALGSKPERHRQVLAPRIPLPISQVTHVSSAFSPEMASGHTPVNPKDRLRVQPGMVVVAPDIPLFSVEMVVGSVPTSPRLFSAPRMAVPPSQPTHVEARASVEMTAGSVATNPGARLKAQSGQISVPPDVTSFSVDMVVGSRPDRARVLLGVRIPLPVSQPTHVAAPLSADMVIGTRPERNREKLPLRTGWQQSQFSHEAAALSVEMTKGSQPEKNRELLPLRTGVSVSQVTHVPAPFSSSMTYGHQPLRNREQSYLRFRWNQRVCDLNLISGSVAVIRVTGTYQPQITTTGVYAVSVGSTGVYQPSINTTGEFFED